MRLFLDECLSPAIARALNAEGNHVAMHPRDFGGLGAPDRDVLKRCTDHDLVLVTENARDFRALIAAQAIHPGLIVLPCVDRARSEKLLCAAIDFLSERGEAMDIMVNHVLEVSTDPAIQLYPLPGEER